jgi:hypothetical protein
MGTMSAWRRSLQSPAQIVFLTLAGLCVSAVVAMGVMAWRNLRRLDLIRADVENTVRIQRVSVRSQQMLLAHLTDASSIDADALEELSQDVALMSAQPFVTHREGGTGLGLAMVRRLALDLGGELTLENQRPRGALARLVLPRGHA